MFTSLYFFRLDMDRLLICIGSVRPLRLVQGYDCGMAFAYFTIFLL